MQRKTLGDIVVGEHPTQHYKTVFSQKTGFFVRLEEDGYEEPFWAEDGPEFVKEVAISAIDKPIH